MAQITEAIALAIVQRQRAARGNWTPVDRRQEQAIRRLVAADRAGQVTRADIVARLADIARLDTRGRS